MWAGLKSKIMYDLFSYRYYCKYDYSTLQLLPYLKEAIFSILSRELPTPFPVNRSKILESFFSFTL